MKTYLVTGGCGLVGVVPIGDSVRLGAAVNAPLAAPTCDPTADVVPISSRRERSRFS